MRVLVTGGRDFNLPDEVHRILMPIHALFTIEELGHGDADGLDTLAKLWACSMGIDTVAYPVSDREWDLYGSRAGNMRNSAMLRQFKPELGISFPGADGTADMTRKLIDARVRTIVGRWADINHTTINWKVADLG
jgi:hypothetical protein